MRQPSRAVPRPIVGHVRRQQVTGRQHVEIMAGHGAVKIADQQGMTDGRLAGGYQSCLALGVHANRSRLEPGSRTCHRDDACSTT